MYKKLLMCSAILIIAIFSFNVSFANNMLQDAANGVRNVVGGAENAVEGAVQGVSNATRNATSNLENGANNVSNDMMNNGNIDNTTGDNNNNNKRESNMTSMAGTTNNYTATRTATTDNTFMGMNSTAWTWLILGIAGIAIVALVWYYSTQTRSSNNYDNRD